MDLTNILAISGKPDLNELVSRTKNGAIVMNLVNGQKFPVFSSSSISQLSEIRMFTTEDEKPLEEIFQNAYNVLEGKPTDFDPKKADSKVLFDLLAKVLPNYDTDRVHTSDAKKLFSWYNILLAAGKLTAEEEEEKAEETADAPAAKKHAAPKKPVAPKQAAPKATTQAKAAPKRTTTAKKAI
jgi:nucleoid-associated protein YgaU